MIVSDSIGEKALRLVEENRVAAGHPESRMPNEPVVAVVAGDSHAWRVYAMPGFVYCGCPAWKEDRWCSHAIASMLVWYEMLSTRQLAG